jgi:hypothetical protein
MNLRQVAGGGNRGLPAGPHRPPAAFTTRRDNYRILHGFAIAGGRRTAFPRPSRSPMNSTHRLSFRHLALASLLPALLLLPGCKTVEKPTPTPQDPPVARQNKELIGKPLAAAVTFYGPQIMHDRTYLASQLPDGMFYLPIRKRFPAASPASQTTLIRELHWQNGQTRMAVFCIRKGGGWEIFDNTEWVPAAGF